MLSKLKAIVPQSLISLAKKTPKISVGIVCANHSASIESAKEACDINLIDPIFIGQEDKIKEEANNISWDISSYKLINTNNDQEAAIAGTNLAKDNKIKVLIKGNIHTDILMRTYLKKEFGLISGKRLSHIWHMTTNENSKPLFITDGALNVAPRLDVKMHILQNVIEFANKINIPKPRVAVLSGTEDAIESMPSSIEAKEIMVNHIEICQIHQHVCVGDKELFNVFIVSFNRSSVIIPGNDNLPVLKTLALISR